MPDLKTDLKKLGPIRLMPLDRSSLFLPFGRPIADYLRGVVGNHNGMRAQLQRGAVEFSHVVRWTESTRVLRTTGFGELERGGIHESGFAPEAADPAMSGFLSLAKLDTAIERANQPKISPAIAPENLAIAKPRVAALPLRQKMTFGPPPSKAKPAPSPAPASAPKPGPAPVTAKPAPATAAPQKPGPASAPKPIAPVTPVKVVSPAATQPKPVAVIPPAPRPAVAPPAGPKPVAAPPSPKVNTPAARAPEPAPKQGPTPVASARTSAAPLSRAPEVETPIATPAPKPVPVAKAITVAPTKPAETTGASPKPQAPPMPTGRIQPATSPVEAAPAREVVSRGTPKEKEPAALSSPEPPAPKAPAFAEDRLPSIPEPHLGLPSEGESFLSRIPKPVLALAAILFLVGMYFVFGGKNSKNAAPSAGVTVGEDGWAPYEWVSDAVGSRRGRQIQIYRPSVGMSDYQIQFVGQIQSKALGWVFREFDTKNYYAMKIENVRPGAMALTHFAVVDGRESSNSQRELAIDARPGASYRVKLDVSGPRFTVYIGGEPVDFWTDNRLKTGGFGMMTERDEVGAISSIQFSFPKGQ